MRVIQARDIVTSIAGALQYVSYYHPTDFVQALKEAYQKETSAPARNALLQLLVNSKLSAQAKRPVCQDTGVAHVFFKLGMDVRIEAPERVATPSLQTLANEAVAKAYLFADNPLRASMIRDPLGQRKNTGDNSPAIVHVELVEGDTLEIIAVAKGGGVDATLLDVKIETAPSHAALLPVALMPNCAATRFISFSLDGSGPAVLTPPDASVWDDIPAIMPTAGGRRA